MVCKKYNDNDQLYSLKYVLFTKSEGNNFDFFFGAGVPVKIVLLCQLQRNANVTILMMLFSQD